MRRVAIFLALFVVLVSVSACTANTNRTKYDNPSPAKIKETAAKQTDGIPLLLTFDKSDEAHSAVVKQENLLCRWNVKTGTLSFEETSLSAEKVADNLKYKMFARSTGAAVNEDGTIHVYGNSSEDIVNGNIGQTYIEVAFGKPEGKVILQQFKTPLPNTANSLIPLLVSGSPKDFVVLIGYDYGVEDTAGIMMTGGLLLGSFKGSNMSWQEIKGYHASLTAAYTPDTIKVGNRIYIDAKTGLTVQAIDLSSNPIELVDYKPANELLRQTDAQEPAPPGFGLYQDVLLVTGSGFYKGWIWALRNDKCIGKICIDASKKKLTSLKDDKVLWQKSFDENLSEIHLPRQYK